MRPPKKTLNEQETVVLTEDMVMGGKVVSVPLFGGRTEAYDYTWKAHELPTNGRPFTVIADKRRARQSIHRTEFTFVRPSSSALLAFLYGTFSRR